MARKNIVVVVEGPFTMEEIEKMSSKHEGGPEAKGVEFDLFEEAVMLAVVGNIVGSIMNAIHKEDSEPAEQPSTES